MRVLLAEFPPDLAVLELAYNGRLDCHPLAVVDVEPGEKVRVSGTTSGVSYRSIIGRRPDPQTGAMGIAFTELFAASAFLVEKILARAWHKPPRAP